MLFSLLLIHIYIYIRDAVWELEPDAYQDLMIKGHCEVDKCACSQGRTHAGEPGSAILWIG